MLVVREGRGERGEGRGQRGEGRGERGEGKGQRGVIHEFESISLLCSAEEGMRAREEEGVGGDILVGVGA